MPRRLGRARRAALLPGLFAVGMAQAACLSIAANPDGAPLARIALPPADAHFRVVYLHSVTRTPVEEQYRLDGDAIVQTEIAFEQHGPGLPTEPDPGGRWIQRDGRYVVTMNRRFPRRDASAADTQPMLGAAAYTLDLAQWGNRALELAAVPEPCTLP
jgi:hypothetical protein